MPTAVQVGQGSTLKMTIAASLTAIAQVLEISGPSITAPAVETTNLASTSRRRRAGLPDSGPVTATIQYDPTDTTHQFLQTAVNTWPQALVACEVDFGVTTKKATFSAFVSKLEFKGMNEDDNLEADIELTVDGLVTFA